jgi:hypothetical protein
MRKRTAGFLVVLGAIAVFLVAVWNGQPRNNRVWEDNYANAAEISVRGDAFRIAPISSWSYGPKAPTRKASAPFEQTLENVKRVWYVVGLTRDDALAGHSFFLFEFRDGRVLAASVEARLEKNEAYFAPLG